MKKLAAKLWAVLMLMLVSMQTMATDAFTSNRTDFRDESIYFMMTYTSRDRRYGKVKA